MTCYERLRKNIERGEYYNRLENYFNALENDAVKEYHKKHGR